MSDQPTISVIIPVYNDGDLVVDTLRSLSVQTLRPSQIIVVDDGSTRVALPDIDTLVAAATMPVQVIYQDNAGAPSARNKGYRAATGEYVLFCDADVLFVPDALATYYQALCDNPEATFSYCQYYFGKKLMKARPFAIDALYQMNYINTMSLIRRVPEIRWDESLRRFQDWEFFLHLVSSGYTGVFIPSALFTIQKTTGISEWLPSFAYKSPFRYLPYIRQKVQAYEQAAQKVKKMYEKSHRS